MSKEVTIVGAGLCGSLLALYLGQKGYHVTVYEKRADLRKNTISAGRSINLALSDRGLAALRLVGVEKMAKELCIPMKGRMIHNKGTKEFMSPYSGRSDEYINSISRSELTALLMNQAEAHEKVHIIFDTSCEGIDFETNKCVFTDQRAQRPFKIYSDLVFATDGAGSAVRNSFYLNKSFLFSFSQEFLSHGYKELSIEPGINNSFKIEKNALHIWPRENFMLIALPNLDGSFTVTLFLDLKNGKYNFNNLDTQEKVGQLFENEFPDVLEVMPNVKEEFFENPTSPLGIIKCSPWNFEDDVLLLGDAAHAIVPFYGQGMNAAFEDITVLDYLFNQYSGNWDKIMNNFSSRRKINTDAIADLAVDNFHEMKGHVAHPLFVEKRKIEMQLEEIFPDRYYSKYSMVTFQESISYNEAMEKGRAQDKAILQLLHENKISYDSQIDKSDLQIYLKQIENETTSILASKNLLTK